jgi:hypothetical protein
LTLPNDLSTSRRAAIDAFLEKRRASAVVPATRGRLIFAFDATASRQPTWDIACQLQGEMFREAAAISGLDMQLVYYRGAGECCASRWISDGRTLTDRMQRIKCVNGHTQIGKVLCHALQENARQQIQALVFVGDCIEEEPRDLCAFASELSQQKVPVFVFQEGNDPDATAVFAKIARLTKGAHCRFDPGAARELLGLLGAVAAYAAGGLKALRGLSMRRNAGAVKLLQQLR